jgi:D-arabinose 1-dehydrogenase-like Zn-dependent alcohol dehydrogenase
MKAWVYYNKRNIKLEEVSDPVFKDEEVLIETNIEEGFSPPV